MLEQAKLVGPLNNTSSNNLRFQKPVLIEDQQVNVQILERNNDSSDYQNMKS